MLEQQLSFQVGDQVIHWNYGPGVILQLDEKELSGHISQYYVVKLNDLMLWVPINADNPGCLRFPTPAKDFMHLFRILTSPGEPLPTDRYERKLLLTERFKERSPHQFAW
jgi:RNA polymerase-interacting CarD/CdnL/TRCF family regulator